MYQIRLANIIGLDINNAQHSVAIDESLYGVTDKEAFLDYCRDFKDGIQYSTKPERLDTLATAYKKLQNEALLPHDQARSFSKQLSAKVEDARIYLKNELEVGNDRPFSRLTQGGERYFTEKELRALAELGSPMHLILLSEENKLESHLTKLFLGKYVVKAKYASLTDSEKKIKALIGEIK